MNKLLVVIDMQNDFIDGSLGTEEAVAVVHAVADKIEDSRKRGDMIVFTRDTHLVGYLQTQEGRQLPVQHCIKGTEGWEISSKLDTSGAVVIDKGSFGSLELAEYAASKAPSEIELIGLCTDICVISNALILKARLPERKIIVDAKCCAGVTPESHINALRSMKMCQINIINGEGV